MTVTLHFSMSAAIIFPSSECSGMQHKPPLTLTLMKIQPKSHPSKEPFTCWSPPKVIKEHLFVIKITT